MSGTVPRPTPEALRFQPAGLSPKQASEHCELLGGLARWCLKDEVLVTACRHYPNFERYQPLPKPLWRNLPTERGSCWGIFTQPPVAPWPALRPVFVLPFQWREGPHNPFLPDRLKAVADSVKRAVAASTVLEEGQTLEWGLHPHFRSDVDLSGLNSAIDPPSAWAPLAAGLILAIQGVAPDPQVWASGEWNDGIVTVGDLPRKAAFAVECGATEFFVPAGQRYQVQHLLPTGALRTGEGNARQALAEYTERLDANPLPPHPLADEPNADFDICVAYHLRHPKEDRHRIDFDRDFYWTHLYPTIRLRCDKTWEPPTDFNPTHLVTIVTGNPEAVVLVAETIGAKNVLLLYTPSHDRDLDQTPAMEAIRKRLGEDRCMPGPFQDDDSLFSTIPDRIANFRCRHKVSDDCHLVLDITPGTGLMRWVADRAMPAGAWRVYLRHDSLSPKDRRPRPGSERLIRVPQDS